MKVKIGPYVNRWVCYLDDRWLKWRYKDNHWNIDEDQYTVLDSIVVNVSDGIQWIYNHTINLYLDEKQRKIHVRVDCYDVWSMDHTLSYIIVPMLKELKKSKQGAPFVDDEDVPEELRSTSAPPKENEYDLDEHHFKRWDWVLEEMVWAFEQKTRDFWESDYYGSYIPSNDNKPLDGHFEWVDDEGRKAHQARMSNGFRLFGKYYENLWN